MRKVIAISNISLSVFIVAIFILIALRMWSPSFLSGFSEWNGPSATVATILFLAVLIPGVYERFGWRPLAIDIS